MSPYGKRLQEFLLRAEVQKGKLAQAIGISHNHVSQVLKGAKSPFSQEIQDRICLALHLSEGEKTELTQLAGISKKTFRLREGARPEEFHIAALFSDTSSFNVHTYITVAKLAMIASNVIQSDTNWRNDLLKAGPIQGSSIFELETSIRKAAADVTVAHSEKVTWAGLNSRRMGDKHAIRNTMRAIFEGKIKAVVCGIRLGDMEFLRSEVTPYFGTPLLESGFSIQQLSKFTGWKWESISHWIEQGLLESESIRLRGQCCRVVLPPQLLTFRQTYVPMADLARGMGTKSSALFKQLSGIEILGAQRGEDGVMRGALVRIADLCKLAVIGAKAGRDLFVSAHADSR